MVSVLFDKLSSLGILLLSFTIAPISSQNLDVASYSSLNPNHSVSFLQENEFHD
jgi:hypothetical protein